MLLNIQKAGLKRTFSTHNSGQIPANLYSFHIGHIQLYDFRNKSKTIKVKDATKNPRADLYMLYKISPHFDRLITTRWDTSCSLFSSSIVLYVDRLDKRFLQLPTLPNTVCTVGGGRRCLFVLAFISGYTQMLGYRWSKHAGRAHGGQIKDGIPIGNDLPLNSWQR